MTIDEAIEAIVVAGFDEEVIEGGVLEEKDNMRRQFRALADAILLQARMDAADLIAMNVYPSARHHNIPGAHNQP